MSAPHGIKRSNHRESASSFERLREEGVRLAQAASGDRWTDYNLHDPGVTLLEQLCYGLTDIAYRADFPVADHMSGPDDVIAFGKLALHPPDVIFPCRPTTALDYRRVLLDQVEGLDDAQLTLPDPGASEASPAPAGVYRLMLRLAPFLKPAVDSRIADARAAYCAHRNLCEDIDPHVTTVREVNCDLHGDVELGGPRDAVEVLADIYDRCARVIAQTPVYRSAGELVRRGQTVEEAFTGPRTPNGIIDEPWSAASPHPLFVSTLTALIASIEGVGSVQRLALQRDDAPYETDSLPLRGVDWALRLHVPRNASEARTGAIRLTRRGNPVLVAMDQVYDKYEKLQARARAQRTRLDRGTSQHNTAVGSDVVVPESDLGYELPKGTYRDLQRYRSVQEHFPPIYHLGRHTLPEHAPPAERAQIKQLKAYLLLFEQMIANAAAQVQHLRELFTVDATEKTVWWQGLGDDSVPGVEALYREHQTPEQVATTVFTPFDHHIERKSRALDHLLGLHGETYAQNSLRQFYGHASPDEIDELLLQNKVAYLRDIVVLNRDRAGAFDYSRAAWNAEGNCSGLQKRACVLLGFPSARIRSLTEALRSQRRRLAARRPEGESHGESEPRGASELRGDPESRGAPEARGAPEPVTSDHIHRSVPAGYRTQVRTRDEIGRHLRRVHWLRGPEIPAAFFRAGAHADRYHVLSLGGRHRLLLGPDEDEHWWNLGDEFATEDEALRAADSVRYFLRRLNELSEGLHVVEHVLLRPFGSGAGHEGLRIPSDFYAFRLTVVLPSWTVRTHQQSFRAFAAETLAINCPAHIAPNVLWLDYAEMSAFEHLYEAWLEAKRHWFNETDATAQSHRAASERLDHASCRLIEVLQPRPPRPDDDPALYFTELNPGPGGAS